MLQEVFLACQRHKNTVNYSAVALGTHQKKTAKIRQQVPKMISKKHLAILSSVFFTPDPEK